MTLVKFDPYRGFEGISKRINKFVNEFDKGFQIETGGYNPRVDITEDEKNLFVHAELPGMSKESVNIAVSEDKMLTIKGEKKKESLEENTNYIRSERKFGSFSRSFLLPEFVDLEKVEAKFENGVLEIILEKKEPEKPKEIEIAIL